MKGVMSVNKIVKAVNIRKGVFETNSSSSHSVTLRKGGESDTRFFHVDDENRVVVTPDEYGWGYEVLTEPDQKLSYLVTMVMQRLSDNYSVIDDELLHEDEDFKKIVECITTYTDYKDVILSDPTYKSGRFDFYIDHQSYYGSLDEFLSDWGVTMNQLLFDTGVSIIIDNDNK